MSLPSAEAVPLTKKSFHKRPLGIFLIILGVAFAIAAVVFLSLVLIFYRRIMKGEDLSYLLQRQEFTQAASLAGRAGSESDVALIDVVTSDDPTIGPEDAPLTVVEFLDFECPFCLKAFPIMRELTSKNPDKIRYIVRDFPVAELHPDATQAAEAASCAHAQKRFWPYHDKLYQNQGSLGKDNLIAFAEQVGLDVKKFTACLEKGEMRSEVQADYAAGVAAGVRGTPTFFINGRKFEGVIPQEVWDQLLQAVSIGE